MKDISRKRALLKLGYRCNNNCVFCHSAPHRGNDAGLSELLEKITLARELGADMIVLSGGEPTIRRDLLALAAAVKRQGLALGLVTNARMLSYGGLLQSLRKFGLAYAQVSLCGPSAKIHNRLTRSESFRQTRTGLQLLCGQVEEVVVNTVVNNWNLPVLPEMVPLADSLPGVALKFSLVEPEGNALDMFERLVPPLSRTASSIAQLIRGGGDRDLRFDGLPLCLVPTDLWPHESSLREEGFFLMSEAFEKDWFPIDEKHRTHPSLCLECSLRRRCRGVFRQYLERRGAAELAPIDRPYANSFNFAITGRTIRFSGSACPLKTNQLAPPEPLREIFFQTGKGRVEEYRHSGRDFSDATIELVVRQMGQLYMHTHGRPAGGDLSRRLRRLELIEACCNCPRRPLCGGTWRRSRRRGFSAFGNLLARYLRRLRGSVLDIGCGAAPYLKWLSPALARRSISYLGIDPGSAPARLPQGAKYLRVSFQDFLSDAVFDNILAIRSLNHLGSPATALRKMASLAAKNSRLLLSDDEVFGVLRPGAAAATPGRQGRTDFEHRTNLMLDEAAELCRLAGFRPTRWLATDQTECPAWWLECRHSL